MQREPAPPRAEPAAEKVAEVEPREPASPASSSAVSSWTKTLWLRPSDQGIVAGLTCVGLMAFALHWFVSGGLEGHRVDIDQAPALTSKFTVDINKATWPELALLPDIGETIARRIVEHRLKHGPFKTLDELDQVRGVGPKTLAGIRPYLRPIQVKNHAAVPNAR